MPSVDGSSAGYCPSASSRPASVLPIASASTRSLQRWAIVRSSLSQRRPRSVHFASGSAQSWDRLRPSEREWRVRDGDGPERRRQHKPHRVPDARRAKPAVGLHLERARVHHSLPAAVEGRECALSYDQLRRGAGRCVGRGERVPGCMERRGDGGRYHVRLR